MLIHPSSGACDLLAELFHGFYCSHTKKTQQPQDNAAANTRRNTGVLAAVVVEVSLCVSNTTHEITQQMSHKLLRMDVLTSETC